jgi:hypothetical protein
MVIAPCPRRHPQPDAVLLESHCGFVAKASLRLSPGPRLGGEEVHKTVDLVVVLAEITNDNGGDPAQVLQLRGGAWPSAVAAR